MKNLPPTSLLSDVFQILDSRIQYIEYQLRKLSRQSNRTDTKQLDSEHSSLYSMEMIFKQIELHNRSLKLLHLLRSKLNALNAPIIFQLLSDSKFLDYNEEELKKQLGISTSEDEKKDADKSEHTSHFRPLWLGY